MKLLAFVVFTAQLFAAQLDPKLLNLIPDGRRWITGTDAERHHQSALSIFIPVAPLYGQLVEIESTTILIGNATLGANTASVLDERSSLLCPCAIDPQQLGGLFDNWFIIKRPLEFFDAIPPVWPLKYRTEFIELIEEVSGGLRFGANIEVHVEARTRSEGDVTSLAAVAKVMLPAIIQTVPELHRFALIAEAAQAVSINRDGRVITFSGLLAESSLAEISANIAAAGAHVR